jgi:hypothetical protein
MNRRCFLSFSLLAPVAGVMAARDAMAAPATDRWISVLGRPREFIVSEHVGESTFITPNQARKILSVPDELFGADDTTKNLKSWSRPEDKSVSAQFESDLAFLRDEPGVVG